MRYRALPALCMLVVCASFALGQAPAGDLRSAALRLLTLTESDSPNHRARTLIISSECRDKHYDVAMGMLEGLERNDQIQLLSGIASQALKANDSSAATTALTKAFELLPPVQDDQSEFWIAPELVDRALDNNQTALALKFTSKAEDGERKLIALLKIAKFAAQQKDRELTVDVVHKLDEQLKLLDEADQRELLGHTLRIAEIFTILGDPKLTAPALKRAGDMMLADQKVTTSERVLFAKLLAHNGNFDQATSIVESLDPEERWGSLFTLALAYQDLSNQTAALSSFNRGREIALDAKLDNRAISRNAAFVIQLLLHNDDGDAATQLLQRITDSYQLRISAIKVANWQFKKKQLSSASFVLRVASAASSSLVSEKSEAIPIGASGPNVWNKSLDLEALVPEFLNIEDYEGAEAAARAIDHPQYRSQALSEIAMANLRAGERTRARQLLSEAFRLSSKAPHYSFDLAREVALAAIARGFVEVGSKADLSNVVKRFLEEIDKRRDSEENIGLLYELGALMEKNGIRLSKSNQVLLSKVVEKEKDDN